MVRADSPLTAVGDVDRKNVCIAIGAGGAYDLFLSRTHAGEAPALLAAHKCVYPAARAQARADGDGLRAFGSGRSTSR